MQKSLQMDFPNYNFCGHGVNFCGHRVHFAAQMLLQSLSVTSIPHNLIETPLKKCSLFMDLGKVLEMGITFVIIKIQCKLNLLTATLLKKKKENRFFSNLFLIKKNPGKNKRVVFTVEKNSKELIWIGFLPASHLTVSFC